RADRAGVVRAGDGRPEDGAGLRRPLLVADLEQLGDGPRAGPDAPRELVAAGVRAGVPDVGGGAGQEGAGVQHDVRGAEGGAAGAELEGGAGERGRGRWAFKPRVVAPGGSASRG